jgi:rhodanese-related sulfurtransferase
MGSGLSVQDVKANISNNYYQVILDVRSSEERDAGFYPESTHIPINLVKEQFVKIYPNKNTSILIYCRSGARASQAIKILQSQGYTNLSMIDFPYTYLLD